MSFHERFLKQTRVCTQPEPSGIKEILSRISKGDIQSKREAIDDLFDKVLKRQQLSEDVTKKVSGYKSLFISKVYFDASSLLLNQ